MVVPYLIRQFVTRSGQMKISGMAPLDFISGELTGKEPPLGRPGMTMRKSSVIAGTIARCCASPRNDS